MVQESVHFITELIFLFIRCYSAEGKKLLFALELKIHQWSQDSEKYRFLLKKLQCSLYNSLILTRWQACQLVFENLDRFNAHFNQLQSQLESQLKQHFGDLIVINCQNSPYGRLPNTTSVAFNDEKLIGIKILSLTPNLRASVGAACHSTLCKVYICFNY